MAETLRMLVTTGGYKTRLQGVRTPKPLAEWEKLSQRRSTLLVHWPRLYMPAGQPWRIGGAWREGVVTGMLCDGVSDVMGVL